MTLKEYFGDWVKVIDAKELSDIINKLNVLYKTKVITPDYCNVFKAFTLCSLHDLKVIFIGEDPYPQRGIATGVLFGNKASANDNSLSPSLNIIKEAAINFEVPHNCITFDPTLESWAKQGILMINSALTTEVNKTDSHILMWRPFIKKLLINLSVKETGIIYVLFGQQAQSFDTYINNKTNIVLKEKHPAYYARKKERMPNTIFKEIDRLLIERYGESIKWYKEV